MIKEFKVNFELDQETIDLKSKEFAEKALLKELQDYYEGYNSPFRQKIKEVLDSQKVSVHFQLPDLLTTINNAIEKEHKSISDSFIENSFIGDMRQSLKLQPKEIKFSEFLKNILEADHNFYDSDLHKYSADVESEKEKIKIITLTFQNNQIDIRLQSFDEGKTFSFCYKPEKSYSNKQNSVLNRIESYILSLVISASKITDFDVSEFDELFYDKYED